MAPPKSNNADLQVNFASKTIPQLRSLLTGWGVEFAGDDKKPTLLDLADRYAVRRGAHPSVADAREAHFDPNSWTISQLRRFLISQDVPYPANALKEDFVHCFNENTGVWAVDDGSEDEEPSSKPISSEDVPRRPESSTAAVGRAIAGKPPARVSLQASYEDAYQHLPETTSRHPSDSTHRLRRLSRDTARQATPHEVTNTGRPRQSVDWTKMDRLVGLLARSLECLEVGETDRAKLFAIEAIVRFNDVLDQGQTGK